VEITDLGNLDEFFTAEEQSLLKPGQKPVTNYWLEVLRKNPLIGSNN
jgi:hypothetical protein